MTYDVVFEVDPPIQGRRVCLTNIGRVQTPEEAGQKVRELFPGVVAIKRVKLQDTQQKRARRRELRAARAPIRRAPVRRADGG
jgi:hypothetical protein